MTVIISIPERDGMKPFALAAYINPNYCDSGRLGRASCGGVARHGYSSPLKA